MIHLCFFFVDELLLKYSVIILDEAHERTVTTDILFGVIQAAQEKRDSQNLLPLKVLILTRILYTLQNIRRARILKQMCVKNKNKLMI